jgi:hypothetical protein
MFPVHVPAGRTGTARQRRQGPPRKGGPLTIIAMMIASFAVPSRSRSSATTGYSAVLGLIATPILLVNAFSPTSFALLADQLYALFGCSIDVRFRRGALIKMAAAYHVETTN